MSQGVRGLGTGAEDQRPAGDGAGTRRAGWAACPGNTAWWEDGRFDAALAAAVTPKPL